MTHCLVASNDGSLRSISLGVDVLLPPKDFFRHDQPAGTWSAVPEQEVDACRACVAKVLTNSLTGTGFWANYMSENFLVTSRHVLPDAATAEKAKAVFDAEDHLIPVDVMLKPLTFFYTDVSLGITLVACDGVPLQSRKPMALSAGYRPSIGKIVDVWLHPNNKPKRSCVHPVIDIEGDHILYALGDDGGSGAPVLMEAEGHLKIVAVHLDRKVRGVDCGVLIDVFIKRMESRIHATTGDCLTEMMALFQLQDAQLHGPNGESPHGVTTTMAEHIGSAKVQAAGCIFFRELSRAAACNVHAIVQANGVERIIHALDSHVNSVEVQEEGCRALWNLARHDTVITQIFLAGASKSIVTAMMSHKGHSGVQEAACGILSVLACRENQTALGQTLSIEMSVQAMTAHFESEALQVEACRFLENMTRRHSHNQHMAVTSGAVEAIVVAMRAHVGSRAVQEIGCAALRRISDDNKDGQIAILQAGGTEQVVAALKTHLTCEAVQSAGCWALCDLARRNAEGQARIVSADGINTVVASLASHLNCAAVQEAGCRALRYLAVASGNVRRGILLAGGLEKVLAALEAHPDNIAVQNAGKSVLQHLTDVLPAEPTSESGQPTVEQLARLQWQGSDSHPRCWAFG